MTSGMVTILPIVPYVFIAAGAVIIGVFIGRWLMMETDKRIFDKKKKRWRNATQIERIIGQVKNDFMIGWNDFKNKGGKDNGEV